MTMTKIQTLNVLIFQFLFFSTNLSAFWQDCAKNPILPSWCKKQGSLHLSDPQLETWSSNFGGYQVKIEDRQLSVWQREKKRLVFASQKGRSFISAGKGKAEFHESRGSFTLSDELQSICKKQTINSIIARDNVLIVIGELDTEPPHREACQIHYQVILTDKGDGKLNFESKFIQNHFSYNRTYLHFDAPKDEQYFGFGMQFTYANMKGRKLPILVQEQGVGRGLQPISIGAEITNGKGVAGSWHSSYGGVPQFLTNKQRSLYLKNTEYSVFDFKKNGRIGIELFSASLKAQWISAENPKTLLKTFTEYSGRMKPLPEWSDQGAIIGMQGGSEAVRKAWQETKDYNIPVAGFWLQDWVGKRKTSFGSQLWWNWSLDQNHYPGWQNLVKELEAEGAMVMTYINPFLVDVSERTNWQGRDLYQEALKAEFFVKTQEKKLYPIQNTSFYAGLLDITNPDARQWIKEVIKDQLIASGAKGWMADFGEALPMDGFLENSSPNRYHNRYPVEWAKINREAVIESQRDDEILFFSRSAFTQSPAHSRLFWLGDQLVTWDDKDGIKTAVTGLISSGMSGFSLNHSDVGGYTTITHPLMNYHRSEELFKRWTELNAFTAVLRTHEGNIPSANHQFNSNAETLKHFAKFSQVFKLLRPYRRQLMDQAFADGLPLVRHLFLEYPEDSNTFSLRHQFMFGRDMVVAPVLDKGAQKVKFYLPEGRWKHLWSNKVFVKGYHKLAAPMGQPAVFYREGVQELETIAERIRGL